MNYPREVYAIYPYSDQGGVAGVYVGSAHDVHSRFKGHLTSKTGQTELHDLMRRNGFTFQLLGTIKDYSESNLEYDWIDFFKKSGANVFNAYIREGNSKNVYSKFSKPFWNGQSVVWTLKPKERITHPRTFTQFVRERGMTLWHVSYSIGLSPSSLYNRLNGIYTFTDEQLEGLKALFPNEPNAIDQFIVKGEIHE